jgi:hypothetical protein
VANPRSSLGPRRRRRSPWMLRKTAKASANASVAGNAGSTPAPLSRFSRLFGATSTSLRSLRRLIARQGARAPVGRQYEGSSTADGVDCSRHSASTINSVLRSIASDQHYHFPKRQVDDSMRESASNNPKWSRRTPKAAAPCLDMLGPLVTLVKLLARTSLVWMPVVWVPESVTSA